MIIDNSLQAELVYKYRTAGKKMILLDYDGTLVEYKPKPEQAVPSESLLEILRKLAEKPDTEVIIITGRDDADIDSLLGGLPVDIIAGHGAMMKVRGEWIPQVLENTRWKEVIKPLLMKMSLKCPESFIEDKHFSLAWHYRNSAQSSGLICSRELVRIVARYSDSLELKILDGNKVVEIMHKSIGKGIAVKNMMAKKVCDFIISIGDDVTDEEIFDLLRNESYAVTIKVGDGESLAGYGFNYVSDVVLFLKHLSE